MLKGYNSHYLTGVGGSIYISNTLHHLKELGLDSQAIHKTALRLHAHSVHYAHKLTTTRRALEKQKALKALVWSKGLPSTLQIPTSYIFRQRRRLTAIRTNESPFP